MEQQAFGFGRDSLDRGIADGLSRSNADYCPIVEIIFGLSVVYRTGYRLFQKDRIETDRHAIRFLTLHRVEIDEVDLRMSSLEIEEVIVLFDRIYFQYRGFIHIHSDDFYSEQR